MSPRRKIDPVVVGDEVLEVAPDVAELRAEASEQLGAHGLGGAGLAFDWAGDDEARATVAKRDAATAHAATMRERLDTATAEHEAATATAARASGAFDASESVEDFAALERAQSEQARTLIVVDRARARDEAAEGALVVARSAVPTLVRGRILAALLAKHDRLGSPQAAEVDAQVLLDLRTKLSDAMTAIEARAAEIEDLRGQARTLADMLGTSVEFDAPHDKLVRHFAYHTAGTIEGSLAGKAFTFPGVHPRIARVDDDLPEDAIDVVRLRFNDAEITFADTRHENARRTVEADRIAGLRAQRAAFDADVRARRKHARDNQVICAGIVRQVVARMEYGRLLAQDVRFTHSDDGPNERKRLEGLRARAEQIGEMVATLWRKGYPAGDIAPIYYPGDVAFLELVPERLIAKPGHDPVWFAARRLPVFSSVYNTPEYDVDASDEARAAASAKGPLTPDEARAAAIFEALTAHSNPSREAATSTHEHALAS